MTFTRRSFLASTATIGLVWALPSQASSLSIGGHAFGSTWRFSGEPGLDEMRLRPLIEAVIRRVDQQMSPWRADSDISRFNALPSTDWQAMPGDVCRVVSASLDVARATGGAFDPTVGPAVARFGFGRIEGGSGTFDAIGVRGDAVRKTQADMTLDLCGIAKGHALDEIKQALRHEGVTSALVELGGEVAAIGEHPAGRPWQVAIERPGERQITAHRIVAPGQMALASSGHTPNGHRGRIAFSHLIDPRQQRPVDQDLASVSVLAASAMQADALATALTVLGPSRGIELAQEQRIAALFLEPTPSGFRETMTGAFADHVTA
ncbi:MAG: FAD:protein FMN transferase [Rhizobiales bacterium]|nr:FAD:protein FMN transferase [Hyphomicrobiales bacterium]MBO6697564.1 FAD:protein FMN transferase [Hyphomicrobiales bacterium]MBO6736181.1 FAD:protein FMN transferase [Hyphomicrobiales bacterium]MBO6912651.1 FAD:protein FMN transferase [Hyphomicrobiales bacterium]MBO6956384.1 FAD:protein FMN transferase [Hyphomicrobiales bacterium]